MALSSISREVRPGGAVAEARRGAYKLFRWGTGGDWHLDADARRREKGTIRQWTQGFKLFDHLIRFRKLFWSECWCKPTYNRHGQWAFGFRIRNPSVTQLINYPFTVVTGYNNQLWVKFSHLKSDSSNAAYNGLSTGKWSLRNSWWNWTYRI